MTDFYSAATAAAAWAAVLGAFVVLLIQNRAAKRLTCLQLFVQLAGQYDSADMQRSRAQLARKLISDPGARELNDALFVFYENLGVLHRKGLLDEELIWSTFSLDVSVYWKAAQSFVTRGRAELADNSLFTEFEALASFFEERNRALGSPTTDSTVAWFLRLEAQRMLGQ